MSKLTIITSKNNRITYTYNPKSGKEVHLDGVPFLVGNMSGMWRIFAPHLSSSYFMANKPFVYKTRKEAVEYIQANKETLFKHIQSIKIECGEQVIIKKENDVKKTDNEVIAAGEPIAHMVLLVPHGKCCRFGHVMVWDEAKTNAFYRLVNAQVWDTSIVNIEKKMLERGFDLKTVTKTTTQCNYKKKVISFKKYCHENRMVVA